MIKTYNEYKEELLLEKYISEVYEGVDLSKYKEIFSKIKNEIKTDFKFILTFGTSVTLFFPIIDNFLKNSKIQIELTPFNITLASIAALSILIDNNTEKLKGIYEKLKDKKWIEIIKSIVDSIKNIKDLFIEVAKQTGKVIKSLFDMFTYTALFVPFMKILTDVVLTKNISLQNFPSLLGAAGMSVGLIAGKNLAEYIIEKLKEISPKLFNHATN